MANQQLWRRGMNSLKNDGFISTAKKTIAIIMNNKKEITYSKNDNEKSTNVIDMINDGQISYVSFDIFDTLLVRPSRSPTGILKMLSKKSGFTSKELIDMHTIADASAINKKGSLATIDDIYTEIVNLFGLDNKITEKLKNEELDLEWDLIAPREDIRSVFNEAVKNQKTIILITDTYFDKTFIEKLLIKNGFLEYSKLYCSCDLGYRKDDGSLFKYVIQDLNITPNEILHIGDNRKSDYLIPKSMGIGVINIEKKSDYLASPFFSRYLGLSNSLDNELLWGAYANLRSVPMYNFENQFLWKTSFQFGIFLGPLFLSFVKWLITEVKKDDITLLLLCYRDGFLIEKIINIMRQHVDISFKTDELHLPRNIRHAFFGNKQNGLMKSIEDMGIRPEVTVYDFIKYRMYIDDEDLIEKTFQIFVNNGYKELSDSIGNIEKIFGFISPLNDIFKESSTKIIDNTINYCKIKMKEDKIGVFDVGYRGSVNKFIREEIGINTIEYQLLSNSGIFSSKNDNVKTYVHYPTIIAHDTQIMELLIENVLSSQEPELVRVVVSDEEYEYIFKKDNEINEEITEVQSGILAYIEYAMKIFGDRIMTMNLEPYLEWLMIKDYLIAPTEDGARVISRLNRPDSSQIVGKIKDDPFVWWFHNKFN